jgi:hypothetical protein
MTDDGAVVRRYDIARVAPGGEEREIDAVTVEEPLEIRVGTQTTAVTMRTPDRRIPVRLHLQRLFRGGAPRAARAFSMSDGRIQPRRIPAKTSRPTAIANAMPSARQERAVMGRKP